MNICDGGMGKGLRRAPREWDMLGWQRRVDLSLDRRSGRIERYGTYP